MYEHQRVRLDYAPYDCPYLPHITQIPILLVKDAVCSLDLRLDFHELVIGGRCHLLTTKSVRPPPVLSTPSKIIKLSAS